MDIISLLFPVNQACHPRSLRGDFEHMRALFSPSDLHLRVHTAPSAAKHTVFSPVNVVKVRRSQLSGIQAGALPAHVEQSVVLQRDENRYAILGSIENLARKRVHDAAGHRVPLGGERVLDSDGRRAQGCTNRGLVVAEPVELETHRCCRREEADLGIGQLSAMVAVARSAEEVVVQMHVGAVRQRTVTRAVKAQDSWGRLLLLVLLLLG